MARGAQTRAGARFIEEGEKNTRYFLGLEKAPAAANTTTSLKTDDDNAITSQATKKTNICRTPQTPTSQTFSVKTVSCQH